MTDASIEAAPRSTSAVPNARSQRAIEVQGNVENTVDHWGRRSNSVQRRLSRVEIEELIHHRREGASIDALTRRYQLHRTTIIHHLDHAGVRRRRVVRKLTDESVALAAARHERGASLAVVASEFGVH